MISTVALLLFQQRYTFVKYYISRPSSFLKTGKNVNINSDTIILVTNIFYPTSTCFDRGSTVVKVLCYKSEDRWFDPSWCQ